jgi:ABC-type lipoprotein release transport system permease subunit
MRQFFNFMLSKARSVRMVAKIAFRNLVRQFRRNLLLGIGIAVSMCILVVTASFTNGLTDILFNRVMVYMTGHIRVIQDSYVTRRSDVIRDLPRFLKIVRDTVPGIKRIDVSIGAFGRSIGNGKTGMTYLVGIPRDADFYKDTQLEAGHTEDIFKPDVFPGIIMYKNAAKDINVGLNDIVTVRFDTVYGQSQAPKFKVVGLIPSENMFMDVAAFVDQDTLRTMLNLKPDEALGLNIVVDYPEDRRRVIAEANKLHAALTPQAAGVKALFTAGDNRAVADAFALKLDDQTAFQIARDNLQFVKGDLRSLAQAKDGIILTEALAAQLGAEPGAHLTYSYSPKSSTDIIDKELVVKGIVRSPSAFADATAFANPEVFYQTFYWNIPRQAATAAYNAPLFKALLPEWDLLPRSPNTDAAVKQRQKLSRESWKGSKVDVQTMFENASAIVDFPEGVEHGVPGCGAGAFFRDPHRRGEHHEDEHPGAHAGDRHQPGHRDAAWGCQERVRPGDRVPGGPVLCGGSASGLGRDVAPAPCHLRPEGQPVQHVLRAEAPVLCAEGLHDRGEFRHHRPGGLRDSVFHGAARRKAESG